MSDKVVSEAELVSAFERFGITDKKSKEIVKNKKVSQTLFGLLSRVSSDGPLDEKKLALLQQVAVELKGAEVARVDLLVDGILADEIKTNLQVSEGLKYLTSAGEDAELASFQAASGVGIEISESQVESEIKKYLTDIESELTSKRYVMVPKVLGEIRKVPSLKWASPSLFKPIIDKLFLEILGPKDERDVVKKEKKKSSANTEKKGTGAATTTPASERSMFSEGFLGDLHKAGDQPQMYPELIKPHLEFTKGDVFTRFPPEPNGFLHIGHSKAIMVNFGYAAYHKGKCYLRFDDTNPEAEEEVYFNSIKEMVSWLGYKPWKITYSSDYFQELYDLAEKLIEVERAYVCHCKPEEVKVQRGLKEDGTLGGERFGCKHREQTVEENLKKFRAMRDGEYDIGEATLRMKMDLTSSNPQMWDLVAYRVLNTPHHRTGDKWKIYPTYDFTHCLVDSFENISHSLCTLEFRLSRESYEWLCDVLHVYRPAQREYGRLNITGTVLSKRKIAKLVNEHYVRGWDDPRLFTLEAIKRRGVPPGAILSFINTLGVTTTDSNIQVVRFESAIRNYLDHTTPRLLMVLDPIKVVIDNYDPALHGEDIDVPYKPGKGGENFGSRKVKLSSTIYIERNDFREGVADSEEYFRLTPSQPVGLIRVPYTISVNKVVKNAEGQIETIHVKYNHGEQIKPKTFIQWVGDNNKLPIKEIRVYKQLFKSENPNQNPEGFLSDINPDSEHVLTSGIVEKAGFNEIEAKSPLNVEVPGSQFNIAEQKGNNTVRFQALRVGYFCVDKDSSSEGLILNRIVTLKEDSSKN
ncbi:glutaminyl-tRNA synthetase [Scheffersomyces amazonensis]|uniref:glutaminyl-tRNA synthetase n=1 Tax=Scheffersomyces amazonensis TaxID=1078765 RepID=UPI00315D3DC3